MRNLQVCAMFVRQLKLMILMNCVQSEDCAILKIAFICTHVRIMAMYCRLFLILSSLAPMHEKMVAARERGRQTPNAETW